MTLLAPRPTAPSRVVRALAAVLGVLGVLAFALRGGPDPEPVPPVPAAVANPTDVAWLQLMIPMNDRMLALLDLAPDRAADPGLRALAARVAAGHRAELPRLRALLAGAGVPELPLHAGHDMPGMVPAAELAAAAGARGTAFDRVLLTGLRAHLAQSVRIARGERTAGADPGTRALAAELETTRGGELARLPAPGA